MGEAMPRQFFLKGKSRHWFWPLLVVSLLSMLYHAFGSTLTTYIGSGSGFAVSFAVSAVMMLFFFACWVLLLLMYGIKNEVKAYKVLFIVLACFELPGLLGGLLYDYSYLRVITHSDVAQLIPYDTIMGISSAITYVSAVAWAVCLVVMACGRKAGVLLRVSSVLLALFYLYIIAYSIAMPFVFRLMASENIFQLLPTINTIANIVNALFQMAATVFFFAAMSFTRQKAPKAAAVPASGAAV